MLKLSKYVKLGFLVVFAITALVWGLSYLKGHDFFKPVNYYYCRYERVDGLQESSPVVVNGYRVGSVRNIRFAADRSGDLIVTLMIDDNFRLPVLSVARIVSSDIMGTRSVKLVYAPGNQYFAPGDTIPGEVESDLKEQVSLQVLPLKRKAEELLSTLDSAITVLTVFFNEEARRNLSESFENINQTIYSLEKTSGDLQELVSQRKASMGNLIGNLENFSGTLKNNSEQFDNVIRNLSRFSDTLAATPYQPVMENLSQSVRSLESLLAKLNSGGSTAGLLFNDDELYYQVAGIAGQLETLVADIRNNPRRYLSFSAVNLGKEVYLSTAGTASGTGKGITFRVHLLTASQPLPPETPGFEELVPVEEQEPDGEYAYYAGDFADYASAEKKLFAARRRFPDASIQAFRDGKIIPLERAIRRLKQ